MSDDTKNGTPTSVPSPREPTSVRVAMVSNAVTAIGIALIAGIWLKRELMPPPHPLDPRPVADWRYYATEGSGKRIGPTSGSVTITVFSDFECPFCRRFAEEFERVRDRYPSEVTLVFRHFPIPRHVSAEPAAVAAECAHQQGRFEQMHNALFADQDSLALDRWVSQAASAGVADTVLFKACLTSPSARSAVAADMRAGERLGADATPTVLVNGWRIMGPADAAAMNELIRRELK
jgi:protein-disulfide isomerase